MLKKLEMLKDQLFVHFFFSSCSSIDRFVYGNGQFSMPWSSSDSAKWKGVCAVEKPVLVIILYFPSDHLCLFLWHFGNKKKVKFPWAISYTRKDNHYKLRCISLKWSMIVMVTFISNTYCISLNWSSRKA